VNIMTTPTTPLPPERGRHQQEPGRYPQEQERYPAGQGPYPPGPRRTRPTVDARQLWAGGVATAVVAGLVALVGVLVCRWLFNIPILAPRRDGAYGDAHTTTLVLVAAGAALVATIIAHLLLLGVPRAMLFFGWIVALVTVVFVIFPFRTGAPLKQEVATAAVYLVIGLAIGILLSGVGERAGRVRPVVTTQATVRQEYRDDYRDLG
jgi:hypothetical protein